jgi:serine/threonine-protein kinase
MSEHVTLLGPAADGPGSRGTPSELPLDLLDQAAHRLRILALVYAVTFFLAGFLPMVLVPDDRALLAASPLHWVPGTTAILLALLIAYLISTNRLPLPAVMTVGLVFEVIGSYGIAAAEFVTQAGGDELKGRLVGLSWVAVWTMLFTIVVPARPGRTVVAALASVSSVPVTVGLLIALDRFEFRPDPGQFFFWLVLPYLLVVWMAWLGARVVYGLGTEVIRARELGSYRLEEKLGEGGMGEVWRARHRMLARPAAIKLIRPSIMASERPGASDSAVRRFEREAQAIARLRSPHTVELFDFGVAAGGTFYYVMELLDGLDADTLVRRFGPLPPERAIHILRQACHSLSEAGAVGLVHRDVKPANIHLCRYGEEFDFVKVLDFGIVRGSPAPEDSDRELTNENAVQGTPAFMAPEQALGQGVDARADIYALGCVGYWLLTGKLVFEGPTAMGLLVDHARTAPTRPSARTEHPIPPSLDDLVLGCLAKDPAARPQSAADLSRRLADVGVKAPWTQDRAKAWWEVNLPAAT